MPILMPARRVALELGRLAVANVVMLGFFTAVTNMLSVEAIKNSILASVPKNTGKLNMNAFEQGFSSALKLGSGK
jgi:2-oxoglutarate ferredoxin oxidoreductase subunit gamma